ncbi:MAG TPA: TIGR03620 family F420-dependent LLM class oxidoreductase [Acidimicrobiales bacterium]|nr:TIGR03620 family F420-dependent LLM class oxidoreductase [Acidimicrobiales bacterium]
MAIAPPSGIYGAAPRRPAARALGRVGIWSSELRVGDARALADQVAELESLGYGAVWVPGREGDVFDVARTYLQATDRLAVATGIVSIWLYDAATVAKAAVALDDASGGRFVLGLGVSHGPLVNTGSATTGDAAPYRHPLAHMAEYLDQLDDRLAAAGGPGTPPSVPRLVAALGPRMLDLAGRRTTGTHPYLVPPEHTAAARQRLGAGPVVAPCQTVTLAQGDEARQMLRQELATYLRFPNYVDNWRRFGVTDDDLAGGGSDRLLELLFAWGGEDAVADRVRAHRQAGADHVCVKVLPGPASGSGAAPAETPLEEWRRLAPALTS